MRELVLYIARSEEEDEHFGPVKLAKLLCFIDFDAFFELGTPVTGATYQKLPQGPAPKEFLAIRDELVRDGHAAEEAHRWPNGRTSHRLKALRDPDPSAFSSGELRLIDGVINRCWFMSAQRISDVSHEMAGWQIAADGDSIPYATAYLPRYSNSEPPSPMTVTDEMRHRAAEMAKLAGV